MSFLDDVSRPLTSAGARKAGISRAEERGSLWRPVYRGVRVWSALPETDLLSRIRAAAALLPPGGAVGGWAAAWLQGAGTLDGETWSGQPLPVLLCLPAERRITRRAGIELLRSPVPASDVVLVGGIWVTTPERTAFDLARRGPLEEAVVALDVLLNTGTVARSSLEAYFGAHPRWDGSPQARAALDHADGRAESPQETRLRLLWTSSGLPRPRCNVAVYDLHGSFLGRPDLLDEEAALAGEFDGGAHSSAARRSKDHRRERSFANHGLTVVKATSVDMFGRPNRIATLSRIEEARANGLARDRRQDRWRASGPVLDHVENFGGTRRRVAAQPST